MKKLKLISATLFVALFTFTGGRALAYDITVENGGSGTYESYQIFIGILSEDGKTLSNIEWGNGITTAGQTALQEKYGVSSAAGLAEALGADDFTTSQTEKFAKIAGQYLQNVGGLTGLTADYYLVQNASVGSNEAHTNYILQVAKDVIVEPKMGVPTAEKKLKDTNDTTGETTDWQDSADYDINDSVPFQLTATSPDNLASYDEYYLELSDTFPAGSTYNKDAKAYLVSGTTKTGVTPLFTIADDGSSFKTNNLEPFDGVTSSTKVVVEYTATLSSNVVTGLEGNPNTVKLIYSNNPNYTSSGETSPIGETPGDKVIVFTYKVVVNKIDQSGNALAGAGFTLCRKDSPGNWNAVSDEITSVTTFTFSGLDDGDYKPSETTTPNGYNTIGDITSTVIADRDIKSDGPALNSLSGDMTAGSLIFASNITEDDASLTTNIVNKKDATLSPIDGVGTIILYTVGTIPVLVAGILPVTKKRMDTK